MAKLVRRFEFYLRPKPPYNFGLTVQKPAGWPLFTPLEVFEKGILWTALHISNILTGLKLHSAGTIERPLINAQVFLENIPTPVQKETIQQALAYRLNIGQDLGTFYYMARKDPILRHTVDDLYGMHDTDPESLFSEATLAILLQMAPLKRSEEMMECMIRNFGEVAEFNNKKIYVWPTPENIARLRAKELGRCKLGYRAKYIQKLAKVLTTTGSPSLEELSHLDPDEAKRKLLKLPGIGDYSADIISPHGGFPIDTWSADVFGKLFYGDGPKQGRGGIGKIKAEGINRWGRFAWMAFLYVAHDLKGLSEKLGISLRFE
jgi:3-methyladenine DNA glycosylase/8-oxoguanine DNA glycosylase